MFVKAYILQSIMLHEKYVLVYMYNKERSCLFFIKMSSYNLINLDLT